VIAKYAELVVIAGRSQEKLDQTVKNIKAETPSANIRTLVIDLNSFASVRKAAGEVNAYPESVNVLINNAGVMACPYGLTEDGFEIQLATNHLGPFLFTSLIFPRIASAAPNLSSPVRIINVSSWGHNYQDFDFNDYGFSEGRTYDELKAYGQSKTCNILFTNELARRSRDKGANVLAFTVHPGGVFTELGRHIDEAERRKRGWLNDDGTYIWPMKTVEEGTSTHIVAAFDPSIKDESGAYLADSHVDEASRNPYAASEESGKKLWELSERLVKQKFEI